MHFQFRLLNVEKSNIYSQQLAYGRYVLGKEIDELHINRSRILTVGQSMDEIKLDTLSRLSNCYGLFLDSLINKDGEFVRPRKTRPQKKQT